MLVALMNLFAMEGNTFELVEGLTENITAVKTLEELGRCRTLRLILKSHTELLFFVY